MSNGAVLISTSVLPSLPSKDRECRVSPGTDALAGFADRLRVWS